MGMIENEPIVARQTASKTVMPQEDLRPPHGMLRLNTSGSEPAKACGATKPLRARTTAEQRYQKGYLKQR